MNNGTSREWQDAKGDYCNSKVLEGQDRDI